MGAAAAYPTMPCLMPYARGGSHEEEEVGLMGLEGRGREGGRQGSGWCGVGGTWLPKGHGRS